MTSRLLLLLALALAACAPVQAIHLPPQIALTADGGRTVNYPTDLSKAKLTVFIFFSKDCLCFAAHEDRIRTLIDTYSSRGVQFVIVDSEVGRTADGDAAEARARRLPSPIFIDSGARLAKSLGAVYATYTVVVDPQGVVRYRGGIDTDKTHLKDDRTQFLADALDDLTAGRPPRLAEGKTLGCALQTW
jgi:AhpC/TSA family